ncbi:hypothetical protein V5O48_010807 [Marasmius crinis-equi]|uniref:Uncharacterized protein n=1 Tax=Marasmius crinis-equi TaxID=585013 RepID=A0ABR3F7C1_9AGAR
MSKTHPELLDVGCIAFSHDDDWMSIVEDHPEEKFPGKIEMIRRISSKFKFVVEQGTLNSLRSRT